MEQIQCQQLLQDVQQRLSGMPDYHEHEKAVFMDSAYADGLAEQTFNALGRDRNFMYVFYRLRQEWEYADTSGFVGQLGELDSDFHRMPMRVRQRHLLFKWFSMMRMCVPRIQSIQYALDRSMVSIPNKYRYVAKQILKDNEKMPLAEQYWTAPAALSILQKIPSGVIMTGRQVYGALRGFPRMDKWREGMPENWFSSELSVKEIYTAITDLAVTAGSGWWDAMAVQECIILLSSIEVYGSCI